MVFGRLQWGIKWNLQVLEIVRRYKILRQRYWLIKIKWKQVENGQNNPADRFCQIYSKKLPKRL